MVTHRYELSFHSKAALRRNIWLSSTAAYHSTHGIQHTHAFARLLQQLECLKCKAANSACNPKTPILLCLVDGSRYAFKEAVRVTVSTMAVADKATRSNFLHFLTGAHLKVSYSKLYSAGQDGAKTRCSARQGLELLKVSL